MIYRFRHIFTIIILLIFSSENIANAYLDAEPEAFSTQSHFSGDTGNLTLLTWILLENENEERGDDKVHSTPGYETSLTLPFSIHQKLNEANPGHFTPTSSSSRQLILKLHCRLSI